MIVYGLEMVKRTRYTTSLLNYCKIKGIEIQPGLEVGYIVLDSRKWVVIPEWEIRNDLATPEFKYYEKMLEKAWGEVSYAFQPKTS